MEGIDIVPPDDAEEFVPPPKRVLFYTLDKKRSIVAEAYAVGNSIKSTARKWRVQPNQIRKWRRQLLEDEPIPQYPEPRTIEERTVIKEQKANKTRHKGRPFTIDEGILNGLLAFVEQVRDEGNAVTTTLVTVELLRRAPELAAVGFVPLRRRVLRFLKNHHLTFRVVTHKAQNHRYHAAIIADYTMYINRQIVASNYGADCILNFDETNIDFDPSPRSTLSKVGERSISIRISGHSGRCTVMLGCTVSGFKFPAFVIWKGVPNGRIDRETHGQAYPHNNIVYAVQPKGWMDGATYQIWVQRVLAPYAAAHNNKIYLLQDMFSVHLHNNSITALNRLGIEVDYIPAGYTPVLQPMDKGIHKPFKQYIREESNAWMVAHQQGEKPTRVDIATWIQHAWNKVSHPTIINTWQSIGIHPMNLP